VLVHVIHADEAVFLLVATIIVRRDANVVETRHHHPTPIHHHMRTEGLECEPWKHWRKSLQEMQRKSTKEMLRLLMTSTIKEGLKLDLEL
jgi:hypothetical protein